jgi:hypothetical protein
MSNFYLENLTAKLGRNFASEWIYAGGDYGCHKNYFELFNDEEKFEEPPHENFCACGHKIKINCYIYNKKLDKLTVLGSCCIKRFLNKPGRTCKDCGESHKNRVVNYCDECRFKYCEGCSKKKNNNYKLCYRCFCSK